MQPSCHPQGIEPARQHTLLSDAALLLLAQQRGSSLSRSISTGASCSSSPTGSGGCADAGLVSLDISGCTGLTDQCWLAIVEASGADGMTCSVPDDLANEAALGMCAHDQGKREPVPNISC